MIVVALDAPEGQAQYLGQVLEDALATKTSLAPVPVNPSFTALRSEALSEAQEVTQDSRSLPEYVAAFSVVPLAPAKFASNIPGVQIARYQAHAFVSLVDRSGRVVFTAHGTGSVEDQIAGVSFQTDQRQDTVVRNALIDAAGKLAQFKPQPLELPVTPIGSRVLVEDRTGAVPSSAELTVLRPAGNFKGISVKVPVGEITTAEFEAGGLVADNSGASPLNLKPGDVVVLEDNGRPLQSRTPVERCAGPQGGAIDDRGAVTFPLFATAADSVFAAQFGGPVHLAQLASKLSFVSAGFGESWKQFQPAKPISAPTCFRRSWQ